MRHTTLSYTILHCTMMILYCTLYSHTWYSAPIHHTTLSYTILHCTMTILHCTLYCLYYTLLCPLTPGTQRLRYPYARQAHHWGVPQPATHRAFNHITACNISSIQACNTSSMPQPGTHRSFNRSRCEHTSRPQAASDYTHIRTRVQPVDAVDQVDPYTHTLTHV